MVGQFQLVLKNLVEPGAGLFLLWMVNQPLRYLLRPYHVPGTMLKNTLMFVKEQCRALQGNEKSFAVNMSLW